MEQDEEEEEEVIEFCGVSLVCYLILHTRICVSSAFSLKETDPLLHD